MADDRWEDQVGSVAEEAQRLLESLRRSGGGAADRADRPDRPAASDGGPGSDAARPGDRDERDARDDSDGRDEHDDDAWVCTDPFCRSCPLCRTVAVVRGLSPETLGRLADLATVAAGVLSDLAAERTRHPAPEDDPADGPTSPAERERPAGGRVSPIPVRDADEDASRG